ncbi:MAG: sensor-containing methyl-accepting chemotaxis protein, partial [Proteobacteria bacterium]|nr:sensor-containing methyl-accepting chemotaxis protein [Pseudomonadota bacterium]
MRIEDLSIRSVTVIIFVMIGLVASILSLFAGSYFRQAALDAQVGSLSRVIEVASQEMLKSVRGHTFDLGMRLAHSDEMIRALHNANRPGGSDQLVGLLNDPFINGFVGFANINLEKIRIYDLNLKFVAESAKGISGLDRHLDGHLVQALSQRKGVERLKAVDALWISPKGPLHSTLVPIGGLRLTGYLEIIINPVFNLPDIGVITQTPISIFSPAGKPILVSDRNDNDSQLPVEYVLPASDGAPAFKIVGYEDVEELNAAMEKTRIVTVSGFLLLTFGTLLSALWLFNRFLFVPVQRMVRDMKQMAAGKLDLTVDKNGLRDFSMLAETFNAMAHQVRQRTNDLERLLDLDDSAILCFGNDQEAVYFNRGAATLFGYAPNEIGDLDLGDLFGEDIAGQMRDAGLPLASPGGKMQAHLTCIRKDGTRFGRDAMIRSLDVRGGQGIAVMLYSARRSEDTLSTETVVTSFQRNEQRMNAVEESLNSLLEIARNAPGFMSVATRIEQLGGEETESGAERPAIREQAVNVMLCALACWERDLDKSKLDLAEESGIWPVYIDKSTPTTRTLDKYLNIETCPRNPRTQRVIDTAEFVLKQLGRRSTGERKKLQHALNDFRQLISGIK